MRFVKNPAEITAEILDGENFPIGKEFFRQVDGVWEIYNGLHDSWVKMKIGDYYRTDVPGDHYPIDKDYMAANYTEKVDPIQCLQDLGFILEDRNNFFYVMDETGDILYTVSNYGVISHICTKTELNQRDINALFSLHLFIKEREKQNANT